MKQKANYDIRLKAEQHGIKLYQIAYVLGINDGNFSRLLRFELPVDKNERIHQIIDQLVKGVNTN